MKLWLISQDTHMDYDTYDSAIVAARTEEDARNIHPNGQGGPLCGHTWVASSEQVDCEYIGTARKDTKQGVVLASFNAG